MRVLCYNLWDGGINEVGGDRQERNLKVLRESKADLIVLPEARGFARDEFATLAEWEKNLGMSGALAPAPSGFHVAMLVRPPLKIVTSQALHPTTFMHACLHAQIESPLGELNVYAVHLNPFDPDARLTEARHIARAAYGEKPVLVLGDFNAFSPRDTIDESVRGLSPRVLARHIFALSPSISEDPPFDTRAIGILEWAGFIDLFRKLHPGEPGWTLPTKVGRPRDSAHMRLDYIFTTESLADRAVGCEVVRTPASDFGSDHYPLLAEFEE